MKKIALNFAPRSVAGVIYQTKPLTWLCVSIGLVLCITAASNLRTLFDRIATQDTTLRRAKSQLNARNDVKPVVKKVSISDAQAVAVNGAIAQLNLPWRDMLDAVEAATPKTIALLTLDPDAKRSVVRGMAEAKTSDDMIAYIEQLKKQAFFSSVLLTKHETNEQDPNKPLRFEFEAQWTGDAP
jgi:Tfp pilus assembly protein PilN